MGNTDSIPVVSQAKSLTQALGGDREGAQQTQENFSRRCPVIAQARALKEHAAGDAEASRETRRCFRENALHALDGVPVVGHVKGTIHYVKGERACGDASMKAASRSTGVIAAGVGGFAAGGPAGAAAAGVAGGVAMDAVISSCDAAARRHNGQSAELRPYGVLHLAAECERSRGDPGVVFDTLFAAVADGAAGAAAGAAARGGVGARAAVLELEPQLRIAAGGSSAAATAVRPDAAYGAEFGSRTRRRMAEAAAGAPPPAADAPAEEHDEWQARLLWRLVRADREHLVAWLAAHPDGEYDGWLRDLGEDAADPRMRLATQPQRALWASCAAGRPQPPPPAKGGEEDGEEDGKWLGGGEGETGARSGGAAPEEEGKDAGDALPAGSIRLRVRTAAAPPAQQVQQE